MPSKVKPKPTKLEIKQQNDEMHLRMFANLQMVYSQFKQQQNKLADAFLDEFIVNGYDHTDLIQIDRLSDLIPNMSENKQIIAEDIVTKLEYITILNYNL